MKLIDANKLCMYLADWQFTEDDPKIKKIIETCIEVVEEREAVAAWNPVNLDDPESLPPVDESGWSDLLELSFSNTNLIDIGRYRKTEEGGYFFPGDEEERRYAQYGLFANAWRPMPEPYREEGNE